MKVKAKVPVREIDGKDTRPSDQAEPLIVRSHRIYHNFGALVVLSRGEMTITVSENELTAAIKSCTGLP